MRIEILPVAFIAVLTASAAAPIPDQAALVKEVDARQAQLEQIRENYTFRQTLRTDHLDSAGHVKLSETQEREVFFVNGQRVWRLVKKNGRTLTEAEKSAEDVTVTKRVKEVLKAKPRQRRPSLLRQILAVAKTSNPQRIAYKGRDTFVFDFAGDTSTKANDLTGRALQRVTGKIWIDEADHQVARIEIVFAENFGVGGGLLAKVQKGSRVEIEQTPVGDGLWMQTATEQQLTARVGFKGLHQNEYATSTEFRKFDVASLQKIAAPPAK